MSRSKEGIYGREFHKGLLAFLKPHIMGHKIHGGVFTKRGVVDYLYWLNAQRCSCEYGITRIGTMGIEFKYIPLKRKPKLHFCPTRMLRPEQKTFLIKLNTFGHYGFQATIIEVAARKRILLITRPCDDIIDIRVDMKWVHMHHLKPTFENCHKVLALPRDPKEPHYDYQWFFDMIEDL